MNALIFLLAQRSSLTIPAQRVPILERLLARGIGHAPDPAAEHPFLANFFKLSRTPWPLAALTRALDAEDSRDGVWLRADPAHLRPDIAGARLLAVGTLQLDADEVAALRRTLAPLFGDAGMLLSTPHPDRWYLQLPPAASLPSLSPPWRSLGEDLRAHLPQGPEAARWQRLLNECQMLLHAHPVNQARAASGRATANTLWFWGAGSWPTQISAQVAAIASDDPLLLALARATATPAGLTLPAHASGVALLDLRGARDPVLLDSQWLAPAWRALRAGRLQSITLQFADGERIVAGRARAFAFWRRPRALR